MQVASVIVITAGVILTTFSAAKPKPTSSAAKSDFDLKRYLTGVSLLTLALILGGLLGVVQEKTYADFFRKQQQQVALNEKDPKAAPAKPWQESMFYIHFLSMPMFLSVRKNLISQFQSLTASPALTFTLPSVLQLSPEDSSLNLSRALSLPLPSAYIPLLLNTLTQLVCASGVNRLTTRVSNLTVTVVLVVRKAVSLIISVWLFGGGKRGESMDERGRLLLWSGAACVFLGTIMYSLASGGGKKGVPKKKE
ncbi:hypothetical protein EIP86_010324 [Pleurotus ostreatoroseus]|nr:hypothetical protein EIP86_010324 [Pleurotus ostreatoroseus]